MEEIEGGAQYTSIETGSLEAGMSCSRGESPDADRAIGVRVTNEALVIDLVDGRSVSAPLEWFPRLVHGSVQERENWRLIGRGEGIHWPDLDEDISVEALLKGFASAESVGSFDAWRAAHKR